MKLIDVGIGNYYGVVEAVEKDGKYYIRLENWDGFNEKEISKELFDALEKEFGFEEVSEEDLER